MTRHFCNDVGMHVMFSTSVLLISATTLLFRTSVLLISVTTLLLNTSVVLISATTLLFSASALLLCATTVQYWIVSSDTYCDVSYSFTSTGLGSSTVI